MARSAPNILLFLTDDHAAWAMGCAGNDELCTPAMDHLARRGTRFARATTPSPVCSPARASFWTGTIPSWHGVHDHLNGFGHPGIGEQTTLAERLQAAGYRTGLVGKWHCHTSEDNRPRPGFDRWFSQRAGTRARFGDQPFWDQDHHVVRHGHQAAILSDEAVAFLRDDDPRPWFLCVGYTDTHSPFQDAPERWAERYRDARFDAIPDETLPACHGRLRGGLDKHRPRGREAMAQYYAAVSMIDQQIGRLLDELDNRGVRDDTVVVYTGDHGHCTGHHGVACKGNGTVPQNFFEESLLVPLIVDAPGAPGGRVCHRPVDHCDSFAGLLDLAGVSAQVDDVPRPGSSWRPLLADPDAPWRGHTVSEYGNARMAADARGKLIRRFPGPHGRPGDEYYDLAADPRETRNAIADPAHEQHIAELDRVLTAHFEAYAHPERSGIEIASQPQHNAAEPWRAALEEE